MKCSLSSLFLFLLNLGNISTKLHRIHSKHLQYITPKLFDRNYGNVRLPHDSNVTNRKGQKIHLARASRYFGFLILKIPEYPQNTRNIPAGDHTSSFAFPLYGVSETITFL